MQNVMIAYDRACFRHLTGWGHPEKPARIAAVLQALQAAGLLDQHNLLVPRPAELQELYLCHTIGYVAMVREETARAGALGLSDGNCTLSTGDVQICADSWDAALFASGSVLSGVDAVMEKRAKAVFSLMRPPGHHACSNRGMGFCLFNNIAIGARYIQQKYDLSRILIVDWDVHHGNGTQEIFDDDPSVFYFSTHQEGLYPGTGHASETGKGLAQGTKMNIPICAGAKSREEVLHAFRVSLASAMKMFKPQFVLISAGFDGHEHDPLGRFNLRAEDFEELTELVCQISRTYAEGRVVSALEGGYGLEGLAGCTAAHVRGLGK